MEELDVMDRTTGDIPRQRSGADRFRRRIRGTDPRRAGTLRPAPRRSAMCAPGTPRAQPLIVPVLILPVPLVPARVGAGPDRVPRTRACLVPSRPARARAAGPGVRSRTERLLVGVATVLCSAVVVVVLGLVADVSAGGEDAPASEASVPVSSVPVSVTPVPVSAVPVSAVPVSSLPDRSEPGGVGPARADRPR